MATKKTGSFIKWAGGKGQLVERIFERTPNTYDTYFEPFIGGGAVLFYLKPKKAIINDTNEQLINVYRQLQADPRAVIKVVNRFDEGRCDKEYYLQKRKEYNRKITARELDAECAGYMIWINKHCFNGLYRVNNKGLFNVPYNNKQTGRSIDEANIMSIGHYLQENDVKIYCSDFEDVCKQICEDDFVYFDSPYVPISPTASFTDYTKAGFGLKDHERLAELYKSLSKRGIKAMLSNHDVELVHRLYEGYLIESVDVKRNINSNAKKRTGKEVIIRNYS